MINTSFGRGLACAVSSHILWGLLPVYWKLLAFVQPGHILAFRILFSLVLTGAFLLAMKNTAWLSPFGNAKKAFFLVLAALTISVNWGLYIWAVNQGHTIEASLGYYIKPLVSIVLGLVFFRERLGLLQWAAFGLGFLGVLLMTILSGAPPWISLGLALSFGFYGLLKKKITLSALESLGAETLAAAPIGLALLFLPYGNLSDLSGLSVFSWVLLSSIGLATSLPLYFFARGVQSLPLSAMGFIQFISPTFQFLLGVFVFGESFPARNYAAFALIWAAVILYSVSLGRLGRRRKLHRPGREAPNRIAPEEKDAYN
ncbi:MAG: EamA family transporter RarD [Treponema sp.]|jgi:chloramphenicol-sensitive protein RarD|nr:EamA family transporter RarD [Treponema sp.]